MTTQSISFSVMLKQKRLQKSGSVLLQGIKSLALFL